MIFYAPNAPFPAHAEFLAFSEFFEGIPAMQVNGQNLYLSRGLLVVATRSPFAKI